VTSALACPRINWFHACPDRPLLETPHGIGHYTNHIRNKNAPRCLQWGSVAYHRKSLQNLAQAILESKRLCAVMLDTLGREVFVKRDVEVGPDGWPTHGKEVAVPMGGSITLTVDESAVQTDTVFPVNYKDLPGVPLPLVDGRPNVPRFLGLSLGVSANKHKHLCACRLPWVPLNRSLRRVAR
jgi:hypothetical protein